MRLLSKILQSKLLGIAHILFEASWRKFGQQVSVLLYLVQNTLTGGQLRQRSQSAFKWYPLVGGHASSSSKLWTSGRCPWKSRFWAVTGSPHQFLVFFVCCHVCFGLVLKFLSAAEEMSWDKTLNEFHQVKLSQLLESSIEQSQIIQEEAAHPTLNSEANNLPILRDTHPAHSALFPLLSKITHRIASTLPDLNL